MGDGASEWTREAPTGRCRRRAVCGGAFARNLLGAAVSGAACGTLVGIEAAGDLVRGRRRRGVVLPLLFLAGWTALAAPYLVQPGAMAAAFQNKVIHHEGASTISERLAQTAVALLKPLHFRARDQFMWGNVVDVVSAVLILADMNSSKCIVAINKNPDAAIFKVADYGVVGDLVQVIPPMVQEIKKLG